MPDLRDASYNGPSSNPFAQPPFLYPFEALLGISLGFECYHTAINTSEDIRGSAFREDAPVNVDRLGPGYGVEVAENWLHHPRVF